MSSHPISPTIVNSGLAACIEAPVNGAHGLEGYLTGTQYFYEELLDRYGRRYFRIYPEPTVNSYYETCGPRIFSRYFLALPTERGPRVAPETPKQAAPRPGPIAG